MSITCPGCNTSYAIPAEVLIQAQTVRCVRCHHNWQPVAEKPDDLMSKPLTPAAPREQLFCDLDGAETAIKPEETIQPAPEIAVPKISGFLHFDIEPEEFAAQSGPNVFPAKSASRRDRETVETPNFFPPGNSPSALDGSSGSGYGKLFAAAIAITLFGSSIVFKQTIIAAMPETAGIYKMAGLDTNITGLKFVNVKTSSLQQDGIEQLIISGEVENFTTGSIKVPKIRISMRDDARDEIFFWTATPEQSTLTGGQKTVFRSTINTPPDEAKDLKIHFSNPALESR